MDRRLSRGDASLDAPIGGADGNLTTRMELMPARGQRMDDVLAETEVGDILKDKIHEYGDKLKGREKVIFDDRLMAEEPKTLQELGDVFGVSRERVRQVERRLLDKMKSYLRDEIGEVVDVYEA